MSNLIHVEDIPRNEYSSIRTNPEDGYGVVPCCLCGEDSGYRTELWFGLFDISQWFSHYCVRCRYGCAK